jgi:hypothetical protein
MKWSHPVSLPLLGNGAFQRMVFTRKACMALLFLLVVVAHGWVHATASNVGRPYESWDEITLNNSAHVMSGPTFDRGFRYGSLDNFVQWVAIVTYEYFDPVGRAYPHARYANNVPESWDNPKLAFGPKTWAPPMEYSVFRGQDDREAIFISRKFHLFIVYALVLAIGLTSVAMLGTASLYVLFPLLAFIAAPGMFFQTTQSLPNAINATLSFGAVLFAMLYCDSAKRGLLLASAAFFALALNFKLDAVILAAAPGMALCYVLLRRGAAVALKDAGLAAIVAFAVLAAGRPAMLLNPVMDIRERYHMLFGIAGGAAHSSFDLHANWNALLTFLNLNLLWPGAGHSAGLVVATAFLLAAFGVGIYYWRSKALMLIIGAVLVVVAWPAVILRSALPEGHLLLNGLGIFMATAAMAMLLGYRLGGRTRIAAHAAAAILAIAWIAHIASLGGAALATNRAYAATGGLDPAHSRTLASLDSVKLLADGFSKTILVDQHSYIDLRALRQHGLDARYVNMDDFRAVVGSLDPAQRYLVIFARGSFDRGDGHLRGWEGEMTPQFQAAFLRYQEVLLRLPVKRHYPGSSQAILSVAPINPRDEIFVSELNPPKSPESR